MVTVTTHKVISDEEHYRLIRYFVNWDGSEFSVDCYDGQYDYELPNKYDDDEELQIAIGEYIEQHGIDPGKVHR